MASKKKRVITDDEIGKNNTELKRSCGLAQRP